MDDTELTLSLYHWDCVPEGLREALLQKEWEDVMVRRKPGTHDLWPLRYRREGKHAIIRPAKKGHAPPAFFPAPIDRDAMLTTNLQWFSELSSFYRC